MRICTSPQKHYNKKTPLKLIKDAGTNCNIYSRVFGTYLVPVSDYKPQIRLDHNSIKKHPLAKPMGVLDGSGAKFTQRECNLYHELKLEVFR
ncbi:hypothetical protein NT95_01830 [Oenococcus kitaharae]|nr:hypothetical protein NT95_01830 [Oenococcus kitaharae]